MKRLFIRLIGACCLLLTTTLTASAQRADTLVVTAVEAQLYSQDPGAVALKRGLNIMSDVVFTRTETEGAWELRNRGASNLLAPCTVAGEMQPESFASIQCGPYAFSLNLAGGSVTGRGPQTNPLDLGIVTETTVERVARDTGLRATGVVTQSSSGNPALAIVTVKETGETARTTGDGRYNVAIPNASATLVISFPRAVTREVSVQGTPVAEFAHTVNASLDCEAGTSWYTGNGSLCVASGETGTVLGGAMHPGTSQAIPGATVKLQGTSTQTTTDAGGRYEIRAPLTGVLEISKPGWQSQRVTLRDHNVGIRDGVAVVQPGPARMLCEAGSAWDGNGGCAPCGTGRIPTAVGCLVEVGFVEWYREGTLAPEAAGRHAAENRHVLATADEVEAALSGSILRENVSGLVSGGQRVAAVLRPGLAASVETQAQGLHQGYFYVHADAVARGASVINQIAPPPNEGRQINGRTVTPEEQARFDALNAGMTDADITRERSSTCSYRWNNANLGRPNPPEDNWMIEMWPDPVRASSPDLLVTAAKAFLISRSLPVTDASLAQFAAEIKTDPTRRYEFAPFMLETFYAALTAGTDVYRGHFETWKTCTDYQRAFATLQAWEQYNEGSIPSQYSPVLLSSVNFQHGPSVSEFIAANDPARYGEDGGAAMAALYLPLMAKEGMLDEHPLNPHLAHLSDDMTGMVAGIGVGVGAATVTALVAPSIALVHVSATTAAVTAAESILASATAAASFSPAFAAANPALAATLTANVTAAQTALSTAGPSLGQSVASSLAGPLIVATTAAMVLGVTIAEVVKRDAYQARLEQAVQDSYSFTVPSFLDAPPEDADGRRVALFNLMAKHLIGDPVEHGRLSIEMPPPASTQPVRIQSTWYPDRHLQDVYGALELGAVQPAWTTAQWMLEPTDSGAVRIRSVATPGHYLHWEGGQLQVGPIQPNWSSAMWTIEETAGDPVRIASVWYPNRYLNFDGETMEVVEIQPNWASAQWLLK